MKSGLTGIIVCFVIVMASGDSLAQKVRYPLGIAVAKNKIFISDKDAHSIWEIAGGKAVVFFKGSRKFRTPLNAVRYITADSAGNLIAGDSSTREVYRFSGKSPQPLTNGAIGNPMGISRTKKGDLIVGNIELHEVLRIPAAGGKPVRIARVVAPRGVHVDSQDNVWVLSGGAKQLQKISPAGKIEIVIDKRAFGFPHDITMDAEEKNTFVSDGYGRTIWRIKGGGKPEAFAKGKPFVNPTCLAWHGKNLLVVDPRAKAVFSIDPTGKVAVVFQQK